MAWNFLALLHVIPHNNKNDDDDDNNNNNNNEEEEEETKNNNMKNIYIMHKHITLFYLLVQVFLTSIFIWYILR